jgi:hypothetical protein
MVFFLAPGCFFWLSGILGTEVDDTRDGSWRRSFVAWLYLAAKPPHMGLDVDGLAYRYTILRPVATRGGNRTSLLGVVLSC